MLQQALSLIDLTLCLLRRLFTSISVCPAICFHPCAFASPFVCVFQNRPIYLRYLSVPVYICLSVDISVDIICSSHNITSCNFLFTSILIFVHVVVVVLLLDTYSAAVSAFLLCLSSAFCLSSSLAFASSASSDSPFFCILHLPLRICYLCGSEHNSILSSVLHTRRSAPRSMRLCSR